MNIIKIFSRLGQGPAPVSLQKHVYTSLKPDHRP